MIGKGVHHRDTEREEVRIKGTVYLIIRRRAGFLLLKVGIILRRINERSGFKEIEMKYLLMVCLAALGAGPGFAQEQEQAFTAKVFTAKGTVDCLKKGAPAWVPVTAPFMLEEGDKIKTGFEGKAEIYIKYGSKIRLVSDTLFIVKKVSQQENIVEVARGKMQAWIRKFAGRSFSVRTPAAVCAVRGTVLAVEVTEAGEATWDLFTGSLQISDNRNRTVDLVPYQRLHVTQSGGAAAPEALPSDVSRPSEPSRTKEEKAEIKAEKDMLKGKPQEKPEAGKKEEKKKDEAPAPVEETEVLTVEEPVTSVIPTQEVQENCDVSASSPDCHL